MSEEITTEIVSYVCENAERVRLAVLIHEAFDEVCKKIIHDAARELVDGLCECLPSPPDWIIKESLSGNETFNRFTGLTIRRATWPENLYVGMEAQEARARGWVVGAMGKEDKVTNRSNIKSDLDSQYKTGKTNKYWIWYGNSDVNYRDWDTPEALSDIYLGIKGKSVQYYINELCAIATIVDRAVTPQTLPSHT